jgi:hypothetical protein
MTREQFALLVRRIDVDAAWLRSLSSVIGEIRQHDACYAKALEAVTTALDALHKGS